MVRDERQVRRMETTRDGAVLAVRGETIVDAEVTALPLVAVAPPQG